MRIWQAQPRGGARIGKRANLENILCFWFWQPVKGLSLLPNIWLIIRFLSKVFFFLSFFWGEGGGQSIPSSKYTSEENCHLAFMFKSCLWKFTRLGSAKWRLRNKESGSDKMRRWSLGSISSRFGRINININCNFYFNSRAKNPYIWIMIIITRTNYVIVA